MKVALSSLVVSKDDLFGFILLFSFLHIYLSLLLLRTYILQARLSQPLSEEWSLSSYFISSREGVAKGYEMKGDMWDITCSHLISMSVYDSGVFIHWNKFHWTIIFFTGLRPSVTPIALFNIAENWKEQVSSRNAVATFTSSSVFYHYMDYEHIECHTLTTRNGAAE